MDNLDVKKDKFFMDVEIRANTQSPKSVQHLIRQKGTIVLRRKSKSKGITLEQIQDELGYVQFRIMTNIYKDLKSMNWLENTIKLYEKSYKISKGTIGWSPNFIKKVRRMIQE